MNKLSFVYIYIYIFSWSYEFIVSYCPFSLSILNDGCWPIDHELMHPTEMLCGAGYQKKKKIGLRKKKTLFTNKEIEFIYYRTVCLFYLLYCLHCYGKDLPTRAYETQAFARAWLHYGSKYISLQHSAYLLPAFAKLSQMPIQKVKTSPREKFEGWKFSPGTTWKTHSRVKKVFAVEGEFKVLELPGRAQAIQHLSLIYLIFNSFKTQCP